MSRDRLIVALDVPAPRDALELVDRLGDAACFYKLGLQLLSAGGYMRLIEKLNQRGHKVFADLKFFDVPATVGAAVRGFARPWSGVSNRSRQPGHHGSRCQQ